MDSRKALHPASSGLGRKQGQEGCQPSEPQEGLPSGSMRRHGGDPLCFYLLLLHSTKAFPRLPLRMFNSKHRVSPSAPVFLGVFWGPPSRAGSERALLGCRACQGPAGAGLMGAHLLSQLRASPSVSCSFSLPYSAQSIKCGALCLYPTGPLLELRGWKLSLLNTFQVFHTHLSTANIKN